MTWRINILILALFCCCNCKKQPKELTPKSLVLENKLLYNNSPLMEAEELQTLLQSPNIKIIDFRKKIDYQKGHIPNAIQIWRSDVEDGSFPYKGMMAKREIIESLFSELGIKTSDILVLYDDRGACDAARLWWILKHYGFKNMKILNGGLHAWQAINGKETKKAPLYKKTNFKLLNTNTELLISKDELSKRLKTSKPPKLIDTRTEDEYSGKRQKLGASKAGRIVNSTFLDWAETIDYKNTKKFKCKAELDKLYRQLGIINTDEIVTYCHTGVRSAHTTFVLIALLGYKNVKNYDGSWSEWSYYDDLPFEKDSITVILQ